MAAINETAEELGVSLEYLESQPPWVQEGRAPTGEEITSFVRSQKGGCHEYVAMEPLSHYQGMCALYVHKHYHHCGVPFASKMTCRTGAPGSEGMDPVLWKDFRKNLDRLGSTPEERKRAVKESLRNPVPEAKVEEVVQMISTQVRTGRFTYICEVCGERFESARRRSGPKVCAQCIGYLRARGQGPVQMKKTEKEE